MSGFLLHTQNWSLALLLAISMPALAATVPPETPTEVKVSNRDINRLVCPVAINGIHASDERGLISTISGKNAFLKFQVHQEAGAASYAQEEATLFVACGGETYTLRLQPQNISSQTIFLANPLHKQKANNALYAGMALEEKITDLTLRAIKDDFPASFTVVHQPLTKRQWLANFLPVVCLAKVREVVPEGSGLRLTEFVVVAKEAVTLHEKMFVSDRLAKNIIGLTLGTLSLAKGQKTQLYVVDRQIADVQKELTWMR